MEVADVLMSEAGPLVPMGNPGGTGFASSVTMTLMASERAHALSFISVLICTNDGFTAHLALMGDVPWRFLPRSSPLGLSALAIQLTERRSSMLFAKPKSHWIVVVGLLMGMVLQTHASQRAGWQARLSTRFHSVAGRVVIVDDDTLRIEDFHYDGGGPAVYLYLGRANTNAAFRQGVALGPLLSGPVYRGDDLVIDVPADISLSGGCAGSGDTVGKLAGGS
jgi:hypothetical protein